MQSITFENAAFADVVKKAVQVAASKGEAFEKAGGIVIDVSEEAGARVLATNTDLFYMEWLDPLGTEGGDFRWRLASRLVAAIASALPLGANKSVTLSDDGQTGFVSLQSGTIKSKLPKLRVQDYPQWDAFNPDDLTETEGLTEVLTRVQWAAAADQSVPLSGIHFDGELVECTNRYVIGAMPFKVDIPRDFTIPGGILASIVKANSTGGKVRFGFDSSTNRLRMMPNEHTQLQTITFAMDFPKLHAIRAKLGADTVRVGKQELLDMLQRGEALANIDRQPKLSVWLGKQQIAAQSYLEHHDGAQIGDVIECSGGDHRRMQYSFTPKNLIGAVANAPGDELEISYDANNPRTFWCIQSEGGYEAWVVPRKQAESEN